MKTFLILCTALLLVGCSYSVKVGKKCTPGSTEWSYVWLVKGDTDVSKCDYILILDDSGMG